MKSSVYILLFLFIISSVSAKNIETLRDFQWENRLLLVHLDNQDALDALKSKLTGQENELADRKLVVLATYEDKLNIIYSHEKISPGTALKSEIQAKTQQQPYTLVLIGLDGGSKASYPIQDLELSSIFGRIDSMPMRAAEIRARQNN